jgi:hypothetical protein
MKLFKWDPVTDYDLAGYKLKANSYTDGTWDQATQLTDKLIKRTDYETNQLPKGTYKIFLKSVDTSGNESGSFSSTTLTVDPAAALYHAATDCFALSWSGTISGGTLNVTENIIEPTTTARTNYIPWSDWDPWTEYTAWSDMADATTAWSAWETWSGMTAWETAAPDIADNIVYEHVTDAGSSVTFRPLIFCQAIGTIQIEIADSADNVTYSSYTDYTTDQITNRYLKTKVTISGPEPLLTGLNIQLNV